MYYNTDKGVIFPSPTGVIKLTGDTVKWHIQSVHIHIIYSVDLPHDMCECAFSYRVLWGLKEQRGRRGSLDYQYVFAKHKYNKTHIF